MIPCWFTKSDTKNVINITQTLQNVTNTANAQIYQDMNVVYYFVRNQTEVEIKEMENETADVVATHGTLCSNDSNAAVVRQMFPFDKFYYRSSKGLAYMLGASHIDFLCH
uniref:Uncharacterized protein n=1 Tax=Rhipicephalus microplus TaxID=6941 RepID=A0A6G5A302_RHIMP